MSVVRSESTIDIPTMDSGKIEMRLVSFARDESVRFDGYLDLACTPTL